MTKVEALNDIIENGINLGAGDFVDLESLKIAAGALDKQVPKKPELKDEYYVCPVCGVYQETSEGNPPYCINCGQAIDWEAEE